MLPHATIADIPSDIRAQILARLDEVAATRRVIFRFADGEAHDVDYVDYH